MKLIKMTLKYLTWFVGIMVVSYTLFVLVTSPRTDRDWNLDQAITPEISINGDIVSIKNIRNFTYHTTTDYTPGYYDSTFDLTKISTLDFMVEPFSANPGAAHTLLTFGFSDGKQVAISVEIRKEKGESFSAVKGLLRQYELMYVIADERDVLKLRTNYRRDQVYLYPIKASPEQIKNLFIDMLTRADKLQRKPEFYNTLTSTCTTNIVSHVNKLVPDRISLDYRILLPGYSDRYAYELGLIDTNLPFDEARVRFNINTLAEKYADDPDFSKMIRTGR